ncbi:hypothetical protein B0J13DRAFT_520965 [Dactylonectria estremocensis]|uniref:Uncharacterized protein n=1 Tax=Dactylonectria estremocensis TaxID=1079267 RepID=A0A9P9FE05_9HYPO|nr:hypothetical protein B0J13DRAFT_520965 [Dactylonectria estremocensis]
MSLSSPGPVSLRFCFWLSSSSVQFTVRQASQGMRMQRNGEAYTERSAEQEPPNNANFPGLLETNNTGRGIEVTIRIILVIPVAFIANCFAEVVGAMSSNACIPRSLSASIWLSCAKCYYSEGEREMKHVRLSVIKEK